MVEIPPNAVSMDVVAEWYKLQEELKKIKARESLLRSMIVKFYFPNPKEGTNTHTLPDGYAMKCKHTIDRKIDWGAFQAFREEFNKLGIHQDSLVKLNPELKIREYRELTEEQMKLFDQCLIIKPGSASLEIVLPKKAQSNAGNHTN